MSERSAGTSPTTTPTDTPGADDQEPADGGVAVSPIPSRRSSSPTKPNVKEHRDLRATLSETGPTGKRSSASGTGALRPLSFESKYEKGTSDGDPSRDTSREQRAGEIKIARTRSQLVGSEHSFIEEGPSLNEDATLGDDKSSAEFPSTIGTDTRIYQSEERCISDAAAVPTQRDEEVPELGYQPNLDKAIHVRSEAPVVTLDSSEMEPAIRSAASAPEVRCKVEKASARTEEGTIYTSSSKSKSQPPALSMRVSAELGLKSSETLSRPSENLPLEEQDALKRALVERVEEEEEESIKTDEDALPLIIFKTPDSSSEDTEVEDTVVEKAGGEKADVIKPGQAAQKPYLVDMVADRGGEHAGTFGTRPAEESTPGKAPKRRLSTQVSESQASEWKLVERRSSSDILSKEQEVLMRVPPKVPETPSNENALLHFPISPLESTDSTEGKVSAEDQDTRGMPEPAKLVTLKTLSSPKRLSSRGSSSSHHEFYELSDPTDQGAIVERPDVTVVANAEEMTVVERGPVTLQLQSADKERFVVSRQPGTNICEVSEALREGELQESVTGPAPGKVFAQVVESQPPAEGRRGGHLSSMIREDNLASAADSKASARISLVKPESQYKESVREQDSRRYSNVSHCQPDVAPGVPLTKEPSATQPRRKSLATPSTSSSLYTRRGSSVEPSRSEKHQDDLTTKQNIKGDSARALPQPSIQGILLPGLAPRELALKPDDASAEMRKRSFAASSERPVDRIETVPHKQRVSEGISSAEILKDADGNVSLPQLVTEQRVVDDLPEVNRSEQAANIKDRVNTLVPRKFEDPETSVPNTMCLPLEKIEITNVGLIAHTSLPTEHRPSIRKEDEPLATTEYLAESTPSFTSREVSSPQSQDSSESPLFISPAHDEHKHKAKTVALAEYIDTLANDVTSTAEHSHVTNIYVEDVEEMELEKNTPGGQKLEKPTEVDLNQKFGAPEYNGVAKTAQTAETIRRPELRPELDQTPGSFPRQENISIPGTTQVLETTMRSEEAQKTNTILKSERTQKPDALPEAVQTPHIIPTSEVVIAPEVVQLPGTILKTETVRKAETFQELENPIKSEIGSETVRIPYVPPSSEIISVPEAVQFPGAFLMTEGAQNVETFQKLESPLKPEARAETVAGEPDKRTRGPVAEEAREALQKLEEADELKKLSGMAGPVSDKAVNLRRIVRKLSVLKPDETQWEVEVEKKLSSLESVQQGEKSVLVDTLDEDTTPMLESKVIAVMQERQVELEEVKEKQLIELVATNVPVPFDHFQDHPESRPVPPCSTAKCITVKKSDPLEESLVKTNEDPHYKISEAERAQLAVVEHVQLLTEVFPEGDKQLAELKPLENFPQSGATSYFGKIKRADEEPLTARIITNEGEDVLRTALIVREQTLVITAPAEEKRSLKISSETINRKTTLGKYSALPAEVTRSEETHVGKENSVEINAAGQSEPQLESCSTEIMSSGLRPPADEDRSAVKHSPVTYPLPMEGSLESVKLEVKKVEYFGTSEGGSVDSPEKMKSRPSLVDSINNPEALPPSENPFIIERTDEKKEIVKKQPLVQIKGTAEDTPALKESNAIAGLDAIEYLVSRLTPINGKEVSQVLPSQEPRIRTEEMKSHVPRLLTLEKQKEAIDENGTKQRNLKGQHVAISPREVLQVSSSQELRQPIEEIEAQVPRRLALEKQREAIEYKGGKEDKGKVQTSPISEEDVHQVLFIQQPRIPTKDIQPRLPLALNLEQRIAIEEIKSKEDKLITQPIDITNLELQILSLQEPRKSLEHVGAPVSELPTLQDSRTPIDNMKVKNIKLKTKSSAAAEKKIPQMLPLRDRIDVTEGTDVIKGALHGQRRDIEHIEIKETLNANSSPLDKSEDYHARSPHEEQHCYNSNEPLTEVLEVSEALVLQPITTIEHLKDTEEELKAATFTVIVEGGPKPFFRTEPGKAIEDRQAAVVKLEAEPTAVVKEKTIQAKPRPGQKHGAEQAILLAEPSAVVEEEVPQGLTLIDPARLIENTQVRNEIMIRTPAGVAVNVSSAQPTETTEEVQKWSKIQAQALAEVKAVTPVTPTFTEPSKEVADIQPKKERYVERPSTESKMEVVKWVAGKIPSTSLDSTEPLMDITQSLEKENSKIVVELQELRAVQRGVQLELASEEVEGLGGAVKKASEVKVPKVAQPTTGSSKLEEDIVTTSLAPSTGELTSIGAGRKLEYVKAEEKLVLEVEDLIQASVGPSTGDLIEIGAARPTTGSSKLEEDIVTTPLAPSTGDLTSIGAGRELEYVEAEEKLVLEVEDLIQASIGPSTGDLTEIGAARQDEKIVTGEQMFVQPKADFSQKEEDLTTLLSILEKDETSEEKVKMPDVIKYVLPMAPIILQPEGYLMGKKEEVIRLPVAAASMDVPLELPLDVLPAEESTASMVTARTEISTILPRPKIPGEPDIASDEAVPHAGSSMATATSVGERSSTQSGPSSFLDEEELEAPMPKSFNVPVIHIQYDFRYEDVYRAPPPVAAPGSQEPHHLQDGNILKEEQRVVQQLAKRLQQAASQGTEPYSRRQSGSSGTLFREVPSRPSMTRVDPLPGSSRSRSENDRGTSRLRSTVLASILMFLVVVFLLLYALGALNSKKT